MKPEQRAGLLFGLILSGLMSLVVSGVSTLRAVGLIDGFVPLWLRGWLTAWAIAFPIALVVAPLTRRLVARLVSR